ncbi:DUF2802 domain-containing protein [Glaciecola petra]|uniref:DUF2802 domain-containing protein n=1 Tax=Glaciecola petra TaxID=3075602 RepID=A0ABU2ZMJ0_9ALTE|nr:DUF2802 domain-containing protein [Aestuariibacter sp. P117]MDT0593833.1 DUF2802 domain-containing protein [Aestuariibacter sp. P117]
MALPLSPETLHIITLALVVVLAFFSLFIWSKVRSENQRLTQSIKLLNDLYKHTQEIQKNINKSDADKPEQLTDDVLKKDKALQINETKILGLIKRLDQADNRLEQLEKEDPQIRMYKKATELAAQGLSVEDIMDACQLPRAEVEVLKGLQRK